MGLSSGLSSLWEFHLASLHAPFTPSTQPPEAPAVLGAAELPSEALLLPLTPHGPHSWPAWAARSAFGHGRTPYNPLAVVFHDSRKD